MAGAGWAPPRLDGFILTERLGAGTYATVYKAYRKRDTREVVAIKCVSKRSLNRASVENLLTEIEILKTIRHPHIVELKDFQWDSDHIYLIMEFCAGGDLSRFIRMRRILPEKVARIFLQQLGKGTLPSSVGHPPWGFLGARTLGTQVATCSACALKFLHDHNISHLDLKPQNILLSAPENPQLKLADFGFAQHMSPWDEKHVLRGSPLYMAPEMVCRQQYDARVDLWSVGVILYEALFGRPPFASRSFAELEEKIRSDRAVETDLVVEAVKKDQEGDAPAALSLYCKALEYFVPALHYESDARRKEAIRVKVRQYISRAEELKAVVTSSSKNFLQQGNSAREILKEMAKDKPRLIAALEMASAAMAKEEEGKDDGDTLELYQQSLGELLLLLAAEPAGRRRELLHTEIQTLMARAEYLKDQMKCVHVKHRAEQQQSDLKAKPVLEGLAWSVPALCYPFPGGGLDELGLILISFPTPSPAFSWRTQRPCKSQWQLIRSVGIWGSKHPACASSFQEARRQEPTTCQDAGKPPELLRFGVIHLDLSRFYSPQRRVLAGSSPADIPTEPVRPWRGAGKGLEGFLLK
ncbi:serine/threonine-protein kinase ULK3 isoform X5 [Rissa tridactyla]|uniref:serine/threonine-protein kinase ULK3 isoform X5 n=1 Tax=Rissa tridactyla TaxID=75485 RepID=UPI0023BB00EF|nr:serine/threonine-protein kinase ULK3 isoform X5 [Rissa tridactyla]